MEYFTFENRVLKNKNSMLLHSFPRLYFQMLRILVFFSVSAGKKCVKKKLTTETIETAIV